jgi:hypothetical protein
MHRESCFTALTDYWHGQVASHMSGPSQSGARILRIKDQENIVPFLFFPPTCDSSFRRAQHKKKILIMFLLRLRSGDPPIFLLIFNKFIAFY